MSIDPVQEAFNAATRAERLRPYHTPEMLLVDLIAVCKIVGIQRHELVLEIDEMWDRVTEQSKEEQEHVDA